MRSIQTKFMFLILCCIFLSASFIGGAGILNSERVIDEDSAKIMNLICSEKTAELNALFSRIEQSVSTLAVYTKSEIGHPDQLKNDKNYHAELSKRIEKVAINIANNTEGAVAVYVRFNPDFTPPTSGLFWYRENLGNAFKPITPTDFSLYKSTDIEHVGWYYLPTQKGIPTWLPPYSNKNINVHMVSYVVPLIVDGEVLGVVGMDIDFDMIARNISNTRIYKTGYVFLVDSQGRIMYHHDVAINSVIFEHKQLAHLKDAFTYGSSGDSLIAYNFANQDKKLAFRSLHNGMFLVAAAPLSEIDKSKKELIYHVFIAAIVISILAALLTIAMSRRIVRPLRELTTAAQKIAGGDLSVSITPHDKDEVGILATSFQKTVEHLQKHLDYINGLAYTDSLTGAKSKAAYQEFVKTLNQRIASVKTEFAVVFMDINNLKHVNDTYGHAFGDMLITTSCNLICQTFDQSSVYRIGGDEFVVILDNEDLQNYPALLASFQKSIINHNTNMHHSCFISIALGIAFYQPETDINFSSVFKRADEAMYENKAIMKKQALDKD